MKLKIGAAMLAGALLLGGTATGASAQCVPGVLLDWDQAFAYETNYTPATFTSALNSQLEVVGRLVVLCGPLAGYDPNDPTKEYTIYLTGLTSAGTQKPTATRWTTSYSGGQFFVYEGSPEDTPDPGSMPALPNAAVPSTFTNGTVILSGTLSNFRTQIVLSGGNYNTTLLGNFIVTGGSAAGAFVGTGNGLLQGTWCPNGSGATGLCPLPTGYSAVSNGKFDVPVTPANGSTWGAIKALYR